MPEQFNFKTHQSMLTHRNGQKVTIVRHITEEEDGYDAEVLPMVEIQFTDGYVTQCWPDELSKYTPPATTYGSNGYYRA